MMCIYHHQNFIFINDKMQQTDKP